MAAVTAQGCAAVPCRQSGYGSATLAVTVAVEGGTGFVSACINAGVVDEFVDVLVVGIGGNSGCTAQGVGMAVDTSKAATGRDTGDMCFMGTGEHVGCGGRVGSGDGGCRSTMAGATACVPGSGSPVDGGADAITAAAVAVAVGGGTVTISTVGPVIAFGVGEAGTLADVGSVGRSATTGGTEAEEDGSIRYRCFRKICMGIGSSTVAGGAGKLVCSSTLAGGAGYCTVKTGGNRCRVVVNAMGAG